MTISYDDEFELNDYIRDEDYDDYFMDDEELPETYISVEDLSNRDLLDEVISYVDFGGYEEEHIEALETELYQRLDKWLKED